MLFRSGRTPNPLIGAATILGTVFTGGLVGAAVAANAYEQGKKRENARTFEQALRDWSRRTKQYEGYLKAVDAWKQQCAEVEEHNAKEREVFPQRLEEFRSKEQERRREFEEDLGRAEPRSLVRESTVARL